MNTLIIPVSSIEHLSGVIETSSLPHEEEQLEFDEQLMLDREAYYQDSQY
ncbi:hypothetical protein [Chamaesiphon minutus]|uniref:Uncharacterized protein n=1 Tax=Chamaesiphon minutus (strain ATCC 27169 / PCC 6605) TaxID=1173020 RepID=K9UPT8_CHAP6|nr:hypothetical protein [Chamaesiphon minutus]AFY97102.1 hypothetical protein Cha6605_6276 [Chamaesiphon minutus PCC 6605]